MMHSREIGLNYDGSLGGLFGFIMWMMIAFFEMLRILLGFQEWLKISVMYSIT